jgi:hypothetical protein
MNELEKIKEDFRDFIVENFEECATDDASYISKKYIKEFNWDEVDVDMFIEEIVDKLKQGLINIVETYE